VRAEAGKVPKLCTLDLLHACTSKRLFEITHATSADICMHREKAKTGSLVNMKPLLPTNGCIAAPSEDESEQK
jgi:hypothetical protein